MVSTTYPQQTQERACPRCHRTASVKQVASLYETVAHQHDPRFMPPTSLTVPSYLTKPITWGIVVETVILFAVMVVCATNQFSIWQYLLTVAGICLPIILSAYGFKGMLKDKRQQQAQHTWDEAMATWSQLLYCPADDLVFEPTSPTALEPFQTAPRPLEPVTSVPLTVAFA